MNKKTTCITDKQFDTIISLLYNGNDKIKPNKEMAIILTVTGNCGLRIGDCVQLTKKSFVKDGNDYRYDIHEQKTGKSRTTLIPYQIYNIIMEYAKDKADNELIFDYSIRAIQWKLQQVTSYLGYENVSTHSFRKHAGMNVYKLSGNDIELTRRFLNHSSVSTTQRYLRVDEEDINNLLKNNYSIPFKTA